MNIILFVIKRIDLIDCLRVEFMGKMDVHKMDVHKLCLRMAVDFMTGT